MIREGTVPVREGANLVDDASRLPQIGLKPEEAIMSLADLGAIAGLLVVLGGVGLFMYSRLAKH
ncbi:hypothetical protein [Humidesulfovibrio sp.]